MGQHVFSEANFRLYTHIVLIAAGHDRLVSVTSNIVRKIDIFGVLSLTSYPMRYNISFLKKIKIFFEEFTEFMAFSLFLS